MSVRVTEGAARAIAANERRGMLSSPQLRKVQRKVQRSVTAARTSENQGRRSSSSAIPDPAIERRDHPIEGLSERGQIAVVEEAGVELSTELLEERHPTTVSRRPNLRCRLSGRLNDALDDRDDATSGGCSACLSPRLPATAGRAALWDWPPAPHANWATAPCAIASRRPTKESKRFGVPWVLFSGHPQMLAQ